MDCGYARGPVAPASSGRPPPSGRAARAAPRSRLSSSPFSLRQADIDRRRLSAAHLDLRGVAAIAILPDFEGMRSDGELDHERSSGRAVPPLAIDDHLGV